MNWCRLPYNCETYEDILTYAMKAEWPTDVKRPGSRKQFIPIPPELMKEPILGKLSKVCTEIAIMRIEPRSIFREHIDSNRFCSLTICLHESKSHTFILEPDVLAEDETGRKFVTNNCAFFEEPDYEPGGIYLLNTSRKHGVLNYSYEPRYNGFFTIDKGIRYEDAKELLEDRRITNDRN